MSDKPSEKEFELVFEGVEDSSASLQRVKGVLIGHMELSIPEVQRILENSPLTIKRAAEESELLVSYQNLKEAGAKVLIIRPAHAIQQESENSNEIEFKIDGSPEQKNRKEEQNDLEFEIDLDDVPSEKTKKEKQYALDLDLDAPVNLADLEKELADSLEAEAPAEEKNREEDVLTHTLDTVEPIEGDSLAAALAEFSEEPPPSKEIQAPASVDFSLELMPVTETMELIDSTNIPNDIDENGEWGLNALSSSLAEQGASTQSSKEVKTDLGGPLLELETDDSDKKEKEAAAVLPKNLAEDKSEKSEPLFKAEELDNKQNASKDSFLAPVHFELENHEPIVPTQPAPTVSAPTPQSELSISESGEEKPAAPVSSDNNKQANMQSSEQAAPQATPAAVQPAVQVSKPKPVVKQSRKSKVPAEILVPVLVGGTLLGIANWFYFSSKAESTTDSSIEASFAQAEKVSVQMQQATAAPVKLEARDFAGESSLDERTTKVKLTSDGETISGFTLEFSAPRPPELTPEELVQNMEPHPWVYKIESEGVDFKRQDDGSFNGKGPAKVYIEQGAARNRFIAEVSATLKQMDEQNLSLKVNIALNQTAAEEERAFVAEKSADGVFHVFAKTETTLQKLAPVIKE